MRRIVIAIASTITGLVLLFSWPTSLNRTTALAATPGGTGGAGTTTGTSGAHANGNGNGSGKSTSSGSSGTSSGSGSGSGTATGTKTYTGATAQTRYGPVTVQITVTGGKVSDVQATNYPNGSRTDQVINSYAIPQLNAEALQAGSANIAMVSGATFTSYGYLQSLQDALDQAHL